LLKTQRELQYNLTKYLSNVMSTFLTKKDKNHVLGLLAKCIWC